MHSTHKLPRWGGGPPSETTHQQASEEGIKCPPTLLNRFQYLISLCHLGSGGAPCDDTSLWKSDPKKVTSLNYKNITFLCTATQGGPGVTPSIIVAGTAAQLRRKTRKTPRSARCSPQPPARIIKIPDSPNQVHFKFHFRSIFMQGNCYLALRLEGLLR